MSKSIVHDGNLPESVRITPTGVVFIGELSYEEWEQLVALSTKMKDAFQWAIGDALNYGESRYGEKYANAMEITGLTYPALANFCWVARAVPVENRNAMLSWTHHRVVSKLPHDQQKQMLSEAENKNWSSEVLADIVRGQPIAEGAPRQQIDLPPGLSVTEAKKLLEAASCISRDGVKTCGICPYREK